MTVVVGRRDDLSVVDVEAVGEGQGRALFEVGRNVILIERGLLFVVDENHHDVGGAGRRRP